MPDRAGLTNQATGATLRLWPGVAAASTIVIGFAVGVLLTVSVPDAATVGMFAALLGTLTVAIWWLFFSRAPWSERLGASVVLAGAWFAMRPFLDESILNGAMGFLPVFAFPILAVALVVWAAAARRFTGVVRVVSLIAVMVAAIGLCTTVRTSGVRGGFLEFHWRWTPTPEDRLLARDDGDPAPAPPAPSTSVSEASPAVDVDTDVTEPEEAAAPEPVDAPADPADPAIAHVRPIARREPADWPGFRGPGRDGVVRDVRIATDWSVSPPMELWRRPVGPGWSSFAVDGDRLYTQEQRGDDEIVASYRLSTGEPVWRHRDAVRFWESNAGAGPRGTPTLSDGRIYALGATGVLNALDAATGAVVWSRDVSADAGVEVPMWGFSSSPLATGDLLVIAAGSRLAAYEIATGTPRWFGPAGAFSYSSPHLVEIDGVPQIVHLDGVGALSVEPSTGHVLWRHAWSGGGGAIVQPAVTADGDVLINAIGFTGGDGIRRLAIAQSPGGWTVEERWTSAGLKPYYNDFVVHEGHAYGFDGSILSCIDLTDGSRKWKGGRYGGGQLVLLADQDVLLVVSDGGELALVQAAPDRFQELSRFKAIEGKTWNHPVVIGSTLLVRNGEEMAAFKLATVE